LFGAANSLPELMLFQYVLRIDRTDGRAAAERQQSRNISLALGFLAPLAVGYAVMAPTFEALMAPAAYRGSFASLSAELVPGYFALFAIISAVSPLFQLQGLTWQLSLASLVALAVDLVLVEFTPLAASVDGLAIAYSVSLATALLATTIVAFRASKVRPSPRDLIVITVATAAMALVIRPLNGLPSHAGAALLAILVATVVLAGAYLTFDVGGVRTFLMGASRGALRWRRDPAGPASPEPAAGG